MARSEDEVKRLLRRKWRDAEACYRVLPEQPYMRQTLDATMREIWILEWVLGIGGLSRLSPEVYELAGMSYGEEDMRLSTGSAHTKEEAEEVRERLGVPTPEWEKQRWARIMAECDREFGKKREGGGSS